MSLIPIVCSLATATRIRKGTNLEKELSLGLNFFRVKRNMALFTNLDIGPLDPNFLDMVPLDPNLQSKIS